MVAIQGEAMTVQEKLLTAEEFARLPGIDKKRELVKGRLVEEMSPAKPRHSVVADRFWLYLSRHVEQNDLGLVATELPCILSRDPDTVRVPDVGFVSKKRLEDPNLNEYIPVAPDLAIEVISPGDTVDEVIEKVGEYFNAGTQLVWLAYRQQVYVYTSPEDIQVINMDGTLDGGDVLPGFKLPLRDVFKGLGE
jgi:Uma2 family endonuclease